MNGLSHIDDGTNPQNREAVASEQLQSILRNIERDTKVIFGARRGTFDLDKNKVENFFHLVEQRVGEQNSPSASICEVSVYYNDGTSRKFPSIGEFGNYSETRNRFPTVITLHLAYLIKFPGSETPEKQQIDILIRASESMSETIDMIASDSQVRMSGDKVQISVTDDGTDMGVITYTINHSRVSWGLDIEGHVKAHIDSILEPPTKSDTILKRISGPLNLFTTVFVGLYAVNLIIDLFFSFLYRSDGSTDGADILDIAANYLVNGHIAKYIVASLVVSVIFFALFSAFVSRLTNSMRRPRPSFIVLDEADNKRKKKKLEIYNRRWTRFAFTIGMDLIVAILIFVAEERVTAFFGTLS